MTGLEHLTKRDRLAAHAALGQDTEDRIGREDVEHPRTGVDREALTLAQMQQPGNRIDIRAGDDDAFDRRGAKSAARLKDLLRFDLLAKIRNQRSPSPLMPRDAWLRATTPGSPARARRQASAFEFH